MNYDHITVDHITCSNALTLLLNVYILFLVCLHIYMHTHHKYIHIINTYIYMHIYINAYIHRYSLLFFLSFFFATLIFFHLCANIVFG